MHIPIEEQLRHPADFRVRYRFYTEDEGGRKLLPSQEYRSDFWYEHEDHKSIKLFAIWPEFEDEYGEVITEIERPIPLVGTARMWVVRPQMREHHCGKIQPGLKAYFMEGPRKVAECEIIEILGLQTNPTE